MKSKREYLGKSGATFDQATTCLEISGHGVSYLNFSICNLAIRIIKKPKLAKEKIEVVRHSKHGETQPTLGASFPLLARSKRCMQKPIYLPAS